MTPSYVELHAHSNFSLKEGASHIHEMVTRARELGYPALALTDHDTLAGAMTFAQTARALGMQPIIGAEVTLTGGAHLTLLARTRQGYGDLCRLLSLSHVFNERRHPELDPALLPDFAAGLTLLTGCRQGELARLLQKGQYEEARARASQYRDWFGSGHVYLELQQNLVRGDTWRIREMVALGQELSIPVVATNNPHYHVRERGRLQDCLVAIRNNKSLEETHRERRPNAEFYLKSAQEMGALFAHIPETLENTLAIAEGCDFDLTRDLGYRFPDYSVPEGHTPQSYLEELCYAAARRRYGGIDDWVRRRLEEEFRLIKKHDLAGFLLIYHDIIQEARQVMIDLGLSAPEIPLEERPPGRGRGSSVALLVGYLIGLSHIDPLAFNLKLNRFLTEDMGSVPDIDLDFPRDIREELIKRIHDKWGWERAALTGMIVTYQIKGAIRDLGKALGLPRDQINQLAKRVEHAGASRLREAMYALPEFRDKVEAPVWRDLVELVAELDGFPREIAQHPGGMVVSSSPLNEIVPIRQGAIDGRFILEWDKDAIDDAGFVKIDFLALGALSQMQEALQLIEERTGHYIDLSRIDFEDQNVYAMLHRADTIGIFQVESAAQMQAIIRIKPENLFDMAFEVAAVRPGVGANDGVTHFIRRRLGLEPVIFDHDLEEGPLGRTLGIILYQDQVNELAMSVAGLSGTEADQLRRAFLRRNSEALIAAWREKFLAGAEANGVDTKTALCIFGKFNGQYMFPESHAFAFGVTAYQMAWLKLYYSLEFYVAIFNQQPMGFYNLETLKEDAKRHGVQVLNPEANRSAKEGTIDGQALRLGFLNVLGLGEAGARAIVEAREWGGPFRSLADFVARAGLQREVLENLADAGAFDSFCPDRRQAQWEIGLRYRPTGSQIPLFLPVAQDLVDLPLLTEREEMRGEYRTMGLHPRGHIMAHLRGALSGGVSSSQELGAYGESEGVTVAGLVIRRQRPLGKAVFITLEDEFGHIPLIIWASVYDKYRHVLREPFLLVHGTVSRQEGTLNVVLTHAEAMPRLDYTPKAKNWG